MPEARYEPDDGREPAPVDVEAVIREWEESDGAEARRERVMEEIDRKIERIRSGEVAINPHPPGTFAWRQWEIDRDGEAA